MDKKWFNAFFSTGLFLEERPVMEFVDELRSNESFIEFNASIPQLIFNIDTIYDFLYKQRYTCFCSGVLFTLHYHMLALLYIDFKQSKSQYLETVDIVCTNQVGLDNYPDSFVNKKICSLTLIPSDCGNIRITSNDMVG
jgi:hypothetical protein